MSESSPGLAKASSCEPDLSAHVRAGRFDAFLRGVRNLLDLTQEELAQALGAPISSYKDWEYGRAVPKATVLWKVNLLLAQHNRDSLGRIRCA